MRKLFLSVAVIGITSAIAIGATSAYFSDTEVSSANTFTAGTLDLKIDDQDGAQVAHVTFANVVPAVQWQGAEYDHQWVLKNTGTLPGTVTYKIKNIQNFENGCNAPESVMGDISCLTGTDQGELGSQMKLVFQLNQAPYGYNQDIFPLNAAEGVAYTPVAYHLNPGETKAVFLRSWFISSPSNNLAQGDSVQFDIEFTLAQD